MLLVALPAALLALAYRAEPLGSWWLELLQYVPYPAFLGPALLALLLSWPLGWAWRLAAAGALLLVVTVIMGLALGRADSGTVPLRLMTYNIKAYRADTEPLIADALMREIEQRQPDLLVMQDAWALSDGKHRTANDLTPVAESLFAGRHVYAHDQYVVVSRHPLRDCRTGDLSFRGQAHRYVRCIVLVDGTEVDLVTAHLLSPRMGLNATRREGADGIADWQRNFDDRLTQSRKLAADLGASPRQRPLIVAGDLNAPETSPVIRTLLAQGLRDAFASAGRGYGYTLGHSLRLGISFLRIDHILVSPEIGVSRAYAGGKDGSEHRPVIAELLLRRDRR
ncbi:MAG TPA: endonuclease/exonuclease/phosphatase family protein [Burkholderiaceae bacterium]|nr:endonuclease/exonuclease/phosphatase family protein [Burkholderiaceae bacterium]